MLENLIDNRIGFLGEERQITGHHGLTISKTLERKFMVDLPGWLERNAARTRDMKIFLILRYGEGEDTVGHFAVGAQDLFDLINR